MTLLIKQLMTPWQVESEIASTEQGCQIELAGGKWGSSLAWM